MIKSLTLSIGLALALATPASAAIEWTFSNNDNPAAASTGSGSAAVTLGQLGTGWHSGTTLPFNTFGTTGFWDLGKGGAGDAGSIVLSGMTFSGPATIQVFQWVKTGTYNGTLTWSLNGVGSSLLNPIAMVQDTGNGAWWEYDANLGVGLGVLDQVKITAGSKGAIVDRLTVVPEPATMIAGAILLIPFLLSTFRVLRRKKTA